MTHGSLFSGEGGFDLAAHWMRWENVFHCEWNEFGQRILKFYWPNAISYHDITKTDFTIHRGRIDVLTGGFPCQPYSTAGKRLGKDDYRHLWPEMLRAIREIAPRWIVGENVLGLVNWNGGLVFEEVQADLEAEGYEVQPFLLPAAGVGAPHQRYRIWFVAYSVNNGSMRTSGPVQSTSSQENGGRQEWSKPPGEQMEQFVEPSSLRGNASDTASNRRQRKGAEPEAKEGLQPGPEPTGELEGGFEGLGVHGDATDTSNTGLQRSQDFGSTGKIRPKRNEQFAGRIPSTWQNFPTQSPICSGDDGLPTELDGITFSKWRNESIKAHGNAVVPPLVLQIFKAIQQYDNQ